MCVTNYIPGDTEAIRFFFCDKTNVVLGGVFDIFDTKSAFFIIIMDYLGDVDVNKFFFFDMVDAGVETGKHKGKIRFRF